MNFRKRNLSYRYLMVKLSAMREMQIESSNIKYNDNGAQDDSK